MAINKLKDLKNASLKGRFTLIELIVVFVILAIIIMAGFQFFTATQNTWNISENKRETFENARIALDLISRDLESACYADGAAPFWHWKPNPTTTSIGIYRNELLAFVSDTPLPPNDKCTSTLCEVKYQLYFAPSHDSNEGWLRRSVTGNKDFYGLDDEKWNYLNNLKIGYETTADITSANRYTSAALTANSSSSSDFQKVIPFVLDLSFDCDSGGVIIPPDTTTTKTTKDLLRPYNKTTNPFPSNITITITLMDRVSWNKWIALQSNSVYPTNETAAAKVFREAHQLTFKRSVYLGDRGGQQ